MCCAGKCLVAGHLSKKRAYTLHPPTTAALLSALLNTTTTTWMEVGTSFKEGLQFRPFSRPTTQSAQAQLILKESPFSSLSPMALV